MADALPMSESGRVERYHDEFCRVKQPRMPAHNTEFTSSARHNHLDLCFSYGSRLGRPLLALFLRQPTPGSLPRPPIAVDSLLELRSLGATVFRVAAVFPIEWLEEGIQHGWPFDVDEFLIQLRDDRGGWVQ